MKPSWIVNTSRAALLLSPLLLLEVNPMSESQAQNAEPATTSKEYVYKQIPQGELKIFVDLPPGWSATDKLCGHFWPYPRTWLLQETHT